MRKGLAIVAIMVSLLFLTATNSGNILGIPNTVTTTNINVSASGSTLIVSHSGTQLIYITHYHWIASGTTNSSWVYGTGSNCGTGTNTIDGPMAYVAQTGIATGVGLGAVVVIPSGQDLCFNNSNAVQVGGAVSWTYGN